MNTWTSTRTFTVTLFVIASALLAGCGFTQDKKDAEEVVARHFQTISTNGFDAAMADYGAPFFQKITKEEWAKALTKVSSKLGAYQSYRITSWRINKNAKTTGAGTTVTLQCEVIYSKHTATETFTVFKGLSDSDYKIFGQNINSTALLTE
jgi:hypothetical protein